MAYHTRRDNVAYDYSDYDEMMSHFSRSGAGSAAPAGPEPELRQKPQLQAIPGGKASANKNTLFRPGTFMTLLVVLLVAGVMLHSYMQVAVLTTKVAEGRTNLEELRAIHTALLTKQEYMLSDEAIQEFAEQTGMFKLDNSQIEWFEMSNPDKIEVSGAGAGISGMLDRIMQSFNATLEYLQ